MLTFEQNRDACRRELDAMISALEGLDAAGWASRTRLEGWTVAHLTAHTADAATFQGEAFHRMLKGSTETPEVPELSVGTPDDALERLRAGRDHVVSSLDAVGAGQQDGMVPLPFATLPASIAIVVLLIEYGFHNNDLAAALGRTDPLAADVAATSVETLPGFLPMIDTKPADAPLAFRLEAPSGTTTVVSDGGTWTVGEPGDAPTVTIAGGDSAIALFALGRIPASDPSLTTTGGVDAAARFKHHFPGP